MRFRFPEATGILDLLAVREISSNAHRVDEGLASDLWLVEVLVPFREVSRGGDEGARAAVFQISHQHARLLVGAEPIADGSVRYRLCVVLSNQRARHAERL